MVRVINTANPGTRRNRARRTIAEILRHLMFKRSIDEESKDMAAALVFALREIADSVETTTNAWEKRDYFLKADRFRLEWEWVSKATERLEQAILKEQWEALPGEIAGLVPRFSDIRIAKMTRGEATWKSSYRLLLSEHDRL
jgi:cobalamin biosynthesis Mg chelatase CobN